MGKNPTISLYNDTTKREMYFDENKTKIIKDYASTYNVDIFNSVNPELQLINTESAIKK